MKSAKKINNRTNTAIFYVTGSTVQKIGRAAQADFFGKWVELMNIYVARVLCMTYILAAETLITNSRPTPHVQ